MSLTESANILNRGRDSVSPERFSQIVKDIKQVGILSTLWYPEIMNPLRESAVEFLIQQGIDPNAIVHRTVPGSFELPLGAELLMPCDFVIALGCVIQGDTPHFQFVCDASTQGLIQVQLKHRVPVGFGVLTVNTLEQALARRGKGAEAAHAAFCMYLLSKSLDRI